MAEGGGSCASRGREHLGAALRVPHTEASQSQRRHLEHNIVMKTCEKLTFSQTAGVSEATGAGWVQAQCKRPWVVGEEPGQAVYNAVSEAAAGQTH